MVLAVLYHRIACHTRWFTMAYQFPLLRSIEISEEGEEALPQIPGMIQISHGPIICTKRAVGIVQETGRNLKECNLTKIEWQKSMKTVGSLRDGTHVDFESIFMVA